MARSAWTCVMAALLAAAPAFAGSMFGQNLDDATVAVVVTGAAENPVLGKQAEQIIEESLRRNDVRVLDRAGLDRLLDDELMLAVIANKSATAMLEIQRKYETDVLFVVELAAEATPGIGMSWMGTASLASTAFRTADASVIGSATSPPLGTTGYPSAIGETDLAARQRAVQRATNGLLLRANLPNVSVPEIDPRVTLESSWRSAAANVSALDLSRDSTLLAVLRQDGAALLDLATGNEVERWAFKNSGGAAIAFFADGSGVAAANGKSKVMLCRRGTPRCEERDAKALKKTVSLRFSTDGSRLAAAGKNGSVLVWDLANTGAAPASWRAHGKGPSTVFFLGDGFATTSGDEHTVRTWSSTGGSPRREFVQEMDTGELVAADCAIPCRALAVSLKEIHMARFAPTGGVSGDVGTLRQDREYIRLLDMGSGTEIARFEAHEAAIVSLAFGPSSRFLASADEIGVVKLWDTERARELASVELAGKGKDVVVGLSRDGRTLVAARGGAGIEVWQLK